MSDIDVTQQGKTKPVRCVVVSDKMTKSRTAVIPRLVKDPRFNKYVRRSSRLMFHDEQNLSKAGDEVLVKPCRPHSARKKFELVEVVKEFTE